MKFLAKYNIFLMHEITLQLFNSSLQIGSCYFLTTTQHPVPEFHNVLKMYLKPRSILICTFSYPSTEESTIHIQKHTAFQFYFVNLILLLFLTTTQEPVPEFHKVLKMCIKSSCILMLWHFLIPPQRNPQPETHVNTQDY